MAVPKRAYLSGNIYLKGTNWYLRVRLPTGLDTRRKIGPAWRRAGRPPEGYYTERKARMVLDELLSKYEGFTEGSDPLFKYAAQEYLLWCREDRKLKETTAHEYERIISKNLLPALGEMALSRIAEEDIIALRRSLRDLSASSLNQTRIVLAGIHKYARKSRRYRGEDFSKWFDRAPIRQRTELDVYTPAEVEQLARFVREGKHRVEMDRAWAVSGGLRRLSATEIAERRRVDDQDAVIYKTAAYAGLRMSEVRALRWRDVDFAGSKITIRAGYTDRGGWSTPKSGKSRTVPMASRLAAELDKLSRREFFTAEDDLVFCNALGDVIDGSALYKRFVAACKAAGLRRMTYHSLRHTAGTTWVQQFDLVKIQHWMGHADISTTMRYLHYKPRHEDAAEMDALLDAALGQDELEIAIEEVTDGV